MPNNTKRLSILSQDEVQAFFGLPKFSDEEREIYFALDPDEALILESLRQPGNFSITPCTHGGIVRLPEMRSGR